MLIAWGAKDFIGPALQQAKEYCDEVLVCVAPHSEVMRQFEDGTYDITREFINKNPDVDWVPWDATGHHSITKASILNKMLQRSRYNEPGNWIWILDVDEFYTRQTYLNVKNFVENSKFHHQFDRGEFQEFYFYINTQWFLTGSHLRLFKIKFRGCEFQPTQRWPYAEHPIVFDFKTMPMYHYGMLTNPHAKVAFWQSEYPGNAQNDKVVWIRDIYRNYDLTFQPYWSEENRIRFGIVSPWFSDSFGPTESGTLHKYDEAVYGKHPHFIGEDLLSVPDFRRKYDFLPNRELEDDEE